VSAEREVGAASPDLARLALVLAIGLFWGGNWTAVKLSLQQIPPLTLRAVGFSTGAVVLLLFARWRGLGLRVPVAERPWLVSAGLLNILGFNLCTAFAQLMMPTSRAAIIAFTMPVWATLLSIPVLGDRVHARQWLGLALGLSGLLVLLGPEALAADGGSLLGPALVLLGALSWALGTVVTKRRGHWHSHTVVVTGWQYVVSAAPMVVLALILEERPAALTLTTTLALGYHLVFAICLAQMLWFVIVTRLSVGQATIGTFVIPVVGVGSAVAILGDPLTLRLVAALLLTLGAVACVMLQRRPRLAAAATTQQSRRENE
jgi:drug/metabolite transporter (DMT)-like permease